MDQESLTTLNNFNLKNTISISLDELECEFPRLRDVKLQRSIVEFYFTCTPAICSYVFRKYQKIELLTYLDADLYFFNSPEGIYEELENSSVGIIEHRFNFWNRLLYEKYGKFNVGWVSFRNDDAGRNCLEKWRQDCLTWCHDYLEQGKFGDQKYLDLWPKKFSGIHIIQNKGANIAPWNVGRYNFTRNSETGEIQINGSNLIFYHFASFKQIDKNTYTTSLSSYRTFLSPKIKKLIYDPYLRKMESHKGVLGIDFIVKNRDNQKSFSRKIYSYIGIIRRFIFQDTIEYKRVTQERNNFQKQ